LLTATHGTPASPWSHSPRDGALLPSPRHPCRAPWPPPHRRRGQPRAEPWVTSSCAHHHQENVRIPSPSLPCLFPATKPENPATVHTNTGKLELTVAPPFQTSSAHADPTLASPRSRAAPRPLLFHPRPLEQPRRRRPTPNRRHSRRQPLSRPPRLQFRAPEGARRRPLAFPLPSPRRRRSPSPESTVKPPPPFSDHGQGPHLKRKESSRCFCARSRGYSVKLV
jgi:hypothetical protein